MYTHLLFIYRLLLWEVNEKQKSVNQQVDPQE